MHGFERNEKFVMVAWKFVLLAQKLALLRW